MSELIDIVKSLQSAAERRDREAILAHMGVMEFRDGKIARWRDYFQLDRPPASS